MKYFTIATSAVLTGLSVASSFEASQNATCRVKAPTSGAFVPGNGEVAAYTYAAGALITAARNAFTPSGYRLAFRNAQGASVQPAGYLTYKLIDNPTYDTRQCAKDCEETPECMAFNIFYSRDPKYDRVENPGCTDMECITNVKCALFSEELIAKDAHNERQWSGPNHGGFETVQVGSNGYNKLPTPPDSKIARHITKHLNFDFTHDLQNKAMLGPEVYLTHVLVNDTSYTPAHCAGTCYQVHDCVFFNTYELLLNGTYQGTTCALFSQVLTAKDAINVGYMYDAHQYSIKESVAYAARLDDEVSSPEGSSEDSDSE